MSSPPLRLGIAGLGTVGIGVVKIIRQKANLLAARAGRPIEITAISARSRHKDRGVTLNDYHWEDDPIALARRDDVDVFVELMGGHEGPAKKAVEAAIASGKDVVTANKALLAHHGHALALAAENAGQVIRYEAAVAGGIPVIKALTEGLAANSITRVIGVMNGTCNYILTRMQSAHLPYEEVFEEANQLGYLEADPNLDVGGIDAGHKLSILAALAFGTQVHFDGVMMQGIQQVTIDDIEQAADMGYRIKLLGVARMTGRGLEQRMSPCLVPENSPLGQLEGGTNMCILEGDQVEQIILRGPGAGAGPTASAVMSDVMDLARGLRVPTFGIPAKDMDQAHSAQQAAPTPYYLRMCLNDRPGTLAKVATVLGDHGVSIDRIRQYRHETNIAPVVIVTHQIAQNAIDAAMKEIKALNVLSDASVAMRIETI